MAKNGWMDGNFIYLFRELKDKEWAKMPHRFALWVHLLLRAAWKEHDTIFRGHKYHLMPGDFPTTIRKLAEETGMNRESVRRDIVWLRTASMIVTKTTGGSTLITIVNWTKYQTGVSKPVSNLCQNVGHPPVSLQNKGIGQNKGNQKKKKKPSVSKKKFQEPVEDKDRLDGMEVIQYLNQKTNKHFKAVPPELLARIKEHGVPACKKVIDNKTAAWLNNPQMNQYLRPSTLFRKSNFEGYLNETPKDQIGPGYYDDGFDDPGPAGYEIQGFDE